MACKVLQFTGKRNRRFSAGWQELSSENYNAVFKWLLSEQYSLRKLKILCAFLYLFRPGKAMPKAKGIRRLLSEGKRWTIERVDRDYEELLTEIKTAQEDLSIRQASNHHVEIPYDILKWMCRHGSKEKMVLILEGCRAIRVRRKHLFHLNTEKIANCLGGSGSNYRRAISDMKRDEIIREYPTTLDHRKVWGKLYSWESSGMNWEVDEMHWSDRLQLAVC